MHQSDMIIRNVKNKCSSAKGSRELSQIDAPMCLSLERLDLH